MEDAQSSFALASQLESKGQVKDAYMTYLSTVQRSLQSLYDVRFVHSSIISKPQQYNALLSTMRNCLTHIETIIEQHSPASPTPPRRVKPVSPHHTGDSASKPPLPPKPSRIQKPSIPPKPTRTAPSRPTSPTHSPVKLCDDHFVSLPPKPSHSHVATESPSRPYSVPSRNDVKLTPTSRPYTDISFAQSNNRDDSNVAIHVIAEGEVDPTHLVPAQTNAGDSLSPPGGTFQGADHVPLIPSPPLLTSHRLLQSKLDELESQLKECRCRKQQLTASDNGTPANLDAVSKDDLNQMILHYTKLIADLKQTLNRVRTLYMSAATIPTVLQFQAHIIAYQITLIESAIFNAISPHALLEHSAKHPHPRIVASTDFFNYVTRFIEHSILLPQDASSRAQHIHYWIKVASRCLDLNNYQTLKAIVSALGTPPLQRLRRTWAYIPKKSLLKLEALNDLMSESNNYGQYREHMGMVSAVALINGKSSATVRAEHYAKPTVPFLGTFIHDITYLLAIYKSSDHAHSAGPEDERGISEILTAIERFQKGPRYASVPPTSYLKASQKHYFRPALSNALHRGASGIGRISSGGLFGFGSRDSSGSSIDTASENRDDDENENLEEQQQMATQYILMRSWVSQATVDELSAVREPPRAKSTSAAGTRSSAGTSNGHHTSSIMSNTSSMVRFSAGTASLGTSSTADGSNGDSRPTSMEDNPGSANDETDSHSKSTPAQSVTSPTSSFWPFRRSMDTQRPSTMHESPSEGPGKSTSDPNIAKRSTWGSTHEPNTHTPAPTIPPRPPRPQPMDRSRFQQRPQAHENDFKADLAQRLAKVATQNNTT
ncbi:ras guanine nucleotide exchange factor domain-containing protein [Radiomyces spectabilis]|uniref:ras guanine nucleotide exchange factor domain-containing protein n=1 Tax=Radiomyces spectabilis TaxID=64574 RepID=UPI00221EF0D9|nr:ras guanine nucleotide exchange factor domain-containing protein [Radiomyces spectabilis]KAI8377446.1 ras guanine nucleotide exchange factor domain-containing protein [Radiomyces spectabilis]